MTDENKINRLQEENARLRRELERTRHLASDEVAGYVADYERANRELFIELTELREKYRKTFQEAVKLLSELRKEARGASRGKYSKKGAKFYHAFFK